MIRSRMTALLATGVLVVGMLATMSAPAFASPRRSAPSPRFFSAMAYDAAHGQVVLFGGESSRRPALPNDTWTWDGTDWMQQHPAHSPGSRMYAGSAYDPATSRVLMFGGLDSSGEPVNETWTWDG